MPAMELPPEDFVPVYLSLLALFLMMWLAIPCVFTTLLMIKVCYEERGALWLEEEDETRVPLLVDVSLLV